MSQIGTIDCGFLATYQGQLAEHWDKPQTDVDLEPNAEAARAVLEGYTPKMTEITGKKKRVLSVEWLTACDIVTQDCSDDCTIDGEDADPLCQEYEIECLQETSFKMPVREYRERTIEFAKAYDFNMSMHMKAMDEWIARYVITGLLANAGTNVYEGGVGASSPVFNPTSIPANFWDDSIWGYFNLVNLWNKIKDPTMLSGNLLFQYLFNRQHETMTDAGKAAMSKVGSIKRIYQDPFNVETYAPGSAFLWNRNAVAMLNKAWNPLGPVNAISFANITQWSEKSRYLPNIVYDIFAQETCVGNEFYLATKIQLHGVFAANPAPCDEGNTGILVFECGTGI